MQVSAEKTIGPYPSSNYSFKSRLHGPSARIHRLFRSLMIASIFRRPVFAFRPLFIFRPILSIPVLPALIAGLSVLAYRPAVAQTCVLKNADFKRTVLVDLP